MTKRVVKEIKEAIDSAQRIAVICHINPDGDCVGSALALTLGLKGLGKDAAAFCEHEVSRQFDVLTAIEPLNSQISKSYDLMIAVDCADLQRLGSLASDFKKCASTINIDHHVSNPHFARINLIEECSATCEIIFGLLNELNVRIDEQIATCLFCGICTDTGCFAHSSTTASTHRIAASLLECGIDMDMLIKRFVKQRTFQKARLIAQAINSIRFFHEGKVAIISLLSSDLEQCGCTISDTEGLVNFAVDIEGVLIGVSITQQQDNQFKVSFRSSSDEVSAAQAASYFGGGGHLRAAGCAIWGDIEDVVSKLAKACGDQIPF